MTPKLQQAGILGSNSKSILQGMLERRRYTRNYLTNTSNLFQFSIIIYYFLHFNTTIITTVGIKTKTKRT